MRLTRNSALVLVVAAVAGCDLSATVPPDTRFACQGDQDCAPGFVCAPALGECVPEGTELDAGAPDAGSGDAGFGDAGSEDAGSGDAGSGDAGSGDAGSGDAGSGDAGSGDAGSGDGGSGDGGAGDAGPPQAIAISSAQQALYVGNCSAPFTVQLRNAMGAPTTSGTVTPITVSTAPGITFSPAADCSDAGQGVFDIPAGSTSVSLHYRGLDAGTYTLRAASPGLGQDTQDTFIRHFPDALAITSTPPSPLPAGTCFGLTLQARRGGASTLVAGATPIGLTVSPLNGARFYTASSCTGTPTSTYTLNSGQSTGTVYVKPLTGGPLTLTANAAFGTATQVANVVGAVRVGECAFNSSMNNQVQTLTCPVSPQVTDVARAFLVFQASTVSTATTALHVRCRLLNPSTVECVRRTGAGATTVAWQVFESPTGLRVEHFPPTACALAPMSYQLSNSVTASRSFVLKSASNGGNNFDDDDTQVMTLSSDGVNLTVSPGDCDTFQAQVVDLSGITVTRGALDGGLAVGVRQVEVPVSSTSAATTAVLAQPSTAINGPVPACAALARAEAFTTTRLRFSRGLAAPPDAGCDDVPLAGLAFERIDFGARGVVQQQTVTLAPGALTTTVAITPVDRTRSIVFSGSQVLSGQGTAETDLSASGPVVPAGEALVRFGFVDDATVRVTRDVGSASARVTFFVVELVP